MQCIVMAFELGTKDSAAAKAALSRVHRRDLAAGGTAFQPPRHLQAPRSDAFRKRPGVLKVPIALLEHHASPETDVLPIRPQ